MEKGQHPLPWEYYGVENPNLINDKRFRIVGGQNAVDAYLPIQDFLDTGQIRGSPNERNVGMQSSRGAYFASEYPLASYLEQRNHDAIVREMAHFGKDTNIPRNYLIETSKKFSKNLPNNPLYSYPEEFTQDGGGWVGGKRVVGKGGHKILVPKPDPNLLDVINPANRSGLKITQFDTGEVKRIYTNPNSFTEGKIFSSIPTNTKIVYDRATPLLERPLSTHASNIGVEARIIGNALNRINIPNTPAGLGGAGLALSAITTPIQIADQIKAVTGGYGNSTWDKEYGHSDPLALRALFDLSDGTFQQTIKNPEYAMRNPLGATVYGLATGNMEYPKAFIDAYIPNFLK
jgi:hypothetical protein